MPRQGRIDFPGALHHIMVRGIEKKDIFASDPDKKDLLKRIRTVLLETETPCFAFAVMENHFHLLLQTGNTPLSKVMQSILTGYAVSYNLRHDRVGKLYQNRYKSILCDKDEYLLQLIRYIHLNPMRTFFISTLEDLDRSVLTGHSVLMGNSEWGDDVDWFAIEDVLYNFGSKWGEARKEYRKYIKSGLDNPIDMDFDGGGLVRSMGGEWEYKNTVMNLGFKAETADERILGSGEFVKTVLDYADELEKKRSVLLRDGWDFSRVLSKAADIVGLEEDDLMHKGRGNARSDGRSLLCKWLVDDLGYKRHTVAHELGISGSSVSALVKKGRKTELRIGINL